MILKSLWSSDAVRFAAYTLLLALLAHHELTQADEGGHTQASSLRVGLWIEARGTLEDNGNFIASEIDMVQPGRYEILLGTVERMVSDKSFMLMGQSVEISEKTTFREVTASQLPERRIKLQGYYQGDKRFAARKIYARNPGRSGVTGRIDSIRKTKAGYIARVMNYRILIDEGVKVYHENPLNEYQSSPPRVLNIVDRNRDEEDLFGTGRWIGDKWFVAGQLETVALLEDDYDLDERRPRKRDELLFRARARFIYQPTDWMFAVATVSYVNLWRDDQRGGRLVRDDYRLGESYLYLLDPLELGLSLQAGRVQFDEQREWLYDQELDAVRGIYEQNNFRAEISYSETLADGNLIDESAQNSILYLSNTDEDRHIAAYAVHREFSWPYPTKRTHYGLRAFGEWLPENDSWLEIGWMQGQALSNTERGWAIDIGTTWELNRHISLTAGFAVGQGDDPETRPVENYRQTGLQDNNAKFGGVTSFRYYGELIDPELANLEILTLALGWRAKRRVSVDLVWHQYAQNVASRQLIDTQLKRRPNGINTDLGEEFDFVLGWRTQKTWDLEVILAYFMPGRAFDDSDPAMMGKIQFRYRL